MSFKDLGSIIDQHKNKQGLSMQVEAAMILEEFKQIAQKKWGQMASELQPVSVKNKVLKIRSTNSQLLTLVKTEQDDIVQQINSKFDQSVVESIQLITG